MKNALGIIAEYNPFHKGHEYHLKESKRITNADCVIVVMSGNFVQRGEPALMDKYTRAQMALRNGADLVIELPVISACSSAQYFAKGSIAILNMLNVTHLCFGSESGDITHFNTISDLICDNKKLLDDFIQCAVTTGISYPLARSKGLEHLLSLMPATQNDTNFYSDLIKQSNNILALEYLLEIKQQNSNIIPVTIKRQGSNYNDTELSGAFSSASSIRNKILNTQFIPENSIPKNVFSQMCDYENNHHFVGINDFTDIIKFILLEISAGSSCARIRTNIADLPEYLLNKLIKSAEKSNSISELIENVKSKDLTYTRISRALMHLLLNITYDDYHDFNLAPCKYLRILGLNDTGAQYLSSVKKTISCPIITKPADYKDILEKDIYASNIYNMVANKYCKEPLKNDFQHQITKL